MRPDKMRELLGGYATGTLTERERKLLFEAALDDQRLFDALADEEALRELLADPAYRRELAMALREGPTVSEKLTAWWRRPLPLALAGGVAAMAMALVFLIPAPESGGQFRDVALLPPQAEIAPLEEAVETASQPEETGLGAARTISNKGAAALAGPGDKQKSEARQETPAATPPPAPAAPFQPRKPAAERKKERAQDTERADEKLAEFARRRPATAPVRESDAMDEPAAPAEVRIQPVAAGFRSRAEEERPGIGGYRAAEVERSSLRVVVEVRTVEGNYEGVAPSRSVGLGDTVRLLVDTPGPGYLLVSEHAASGEMPRTVFSGAVTFGRPNYIPPNGGIPAPSGPGVRTMVVLFSPRPIDDDERRRALSFFEGQSAPDEPTRIERVTITYR